MTHMKQNTTAAALDAMDVFPCAVVSYSGMDHRRYVLGDGTITAYSTDAIQIQGDCPVTAGMALALMVALPDSDDHFYLVGARVSSSAWDSFEVDLQQVPEPAKEQLNLLLQRYPGAPADVICAV